MAPDLRGSAGGRQQRSEHADQGRLANPVGTEDRQYFFPRDGQIDAVDRADF
jgi:hypothetical protein